MHDLSPITPLGNHTARTDDFVGLQIVENTDFALASIAMRQRKKVAFHKSAKLFLGAALPDISGVVVKKDIRAFWTAPDQWFVQAPMKSHEDLEQQLNAALTDTASITEQSGGWVQFDLTGPRAADVFERLCAVNIRLMAANTVARTTIEHLGCFITCYEIGQRFTVVSPRSSAASLHHAITTAAKSAI